MKYMFVGGPKDGQPHESETEHLLGYIMDSNADGGTWKRHYYQVNGENLVYRGSPSPKQIRKWGRDAMKRLAKEGVVV